MYKAGLSEIRSACVWHTGVKNDAAEDGRLDPGTKLPKEDLLSRLDPRGGMSKGAILRLSAPLSEGGCPICKLSTGLPILKL